MALQNSLKTALKLKYRKLLSDITFIPPRLCIWDLRDYNVLDVSQHEFRTFDKVELPSDETFSVSEILKCDCKHNSKKRIILTMGLSRIGKTTAVQMSALDWAEGKGYHDIHLLFLLTFWELSLQKQLPDCLSLFELLKIFYPSLKDLDIASLKEKKVWFFLDGLDESQLSLNFSSPPVSDVFHTSSVASVLTSLIRGDLLPNAHIWITTRFATAKDIPDRYLLKVTELQGFSDEQKEEHFTNLIPSQDLANKVIHHVKFSGVLDGLCRVPQLCTIIAHVLKKHLKTHKGFLNLTQVYLKLITPQLLNPYRTPVRKMTMMASRLMKSTSVMYEHEITEDLTVSEASAYCEECPLVLIEEKGLKGARVYRFAHPSIQEFLFASSSLLDSVVPDAPFYLPHCFLVDQTLNHPDGRFDVALRFVFGILKERRMVEDSDRLFLYTKMKLLDNMFSDTAVALFHCLREYDSKAFLSDLKSFLKTDAAPVLTFTPADWSIIIMFLTDFEGLQDTFELEVSHASDKRLLRQLPVVMKSLKAKLRFCNLTYRCCPGLAVVLKTSESRLTQLDLGYNNITDGGVRELTKGLLDKNCKLETLRLQGCGLTSNACKYLAAALGQSPKLRELDLSGNRIGDDGLQHLAMVLRSANCHIHTLKMSYCHIGPKGCICLASALQQNSQHLKVLDLGLNRIRDKGVQALLNKVDISKLTKLELYFCGLTASSCGNIGKALASETSSLMELNLSCNKLYAAGFEQICEGMYAWCSLEKLNVSNCGITSCIYLAKVLCSVSQLYSGGKVQTSWQAVELKELDLSKNDFGDEGVREFSAGLRNPYIHLKTLNLSGCYLTDDCCSELAAVFASAHSILNDLDLSDNNLQDKGVKKLCVGLGNPQCKIEKLVLRNCSLSSMSVKFLTAALKSNPLNLGELHVMGNNLDNSQVRVLMELKKNKKYFLHTIDVSAD
ncbi:NACHT, LRR and PYD domains-containing protein 14-like [Thalassophryne amazonica]|uniref:NACHT, LRR and PYD domains-containing protein 14-like n=1 Tax=Thalassophryne amazonica TaxID=390379 RepID=UPI0014709F0E|nr:NACHT, LRR and PYD domains-containing protein 14-like [Thalassophryne amazonica]